MAENETVEGEEKEHKKHRYFTERDWDNWIEVGSAVLMSLAIIASAWCAYQAARWSGVQSIEFSEAAANRNKSMIFASLAGTEVEIDATVFLDYVLLYTQENISDEQLDLYEERFFTDRLEVAMEAWLATNPLENPDAPRNPFEMEDYQNSNLAIAEATFNIAEIDSQAAKDANQQSDNYVMLTVLFAAVLFFAGVSTKLKMRWIKISILVLGILIFYATALTLSFQSVH
jgi:hypothetical protein